MKLLLLAFLPVSLCMGSNAQAQSVSKALPPEGVMESVVAPAPAKAPAAKSIQAKASPVAESFEPVVFARKASLAVPPEELMPQQAIVKSPKQAPAAKKAVIEMAMKRIDEEDEEYEAPLRQSRPYHVGVMDSEVRCVAQAVFHEARGESLKGQLAVADVVMNRVRSGKWGKSACSVVNAPYQFSGRWSWRAPQPGVAAWDRAISIAKDAVSGITHVSSRLMNFRASYMGAAGPKPVRIGNHIFW